MTATLPLALAAAPAGAGAETPAILRSLGEADARRRNVEEK